MADRNKNAKTFEVKGILVMNPEIRKFWEDAGYTLNDITGSTWIMFWGKKEEATLEWHVATFHASLDPIYYYNYKEYTEAEMLRIIKLKAFL